MKRMNTVTFRGYIFLWPTTKVFPQIVVKRRGASNNYYGRRCTPVSMDAYSMDSVSVYHSFRRKSKRRASGRSMKSYLNQAFDDPVRHDKLGNVGSAQGINIQVWSVWQLKYRPYYTLRTRRQFKRCRLPTNTSPARDVIRERSLTSSWCHLLRKELQQLQGPVVC